MARAGLRGTILRQVQMQLYERCSLKTGYRLQLQQPVGNVRHAGTSDVRLQGGAAHAPYVHRGGRLSPPARPPTGCN
jgi:hypothetical protein